MKRTILVVVLLCVALTTWAQSAQPFKKANTILVTMPDSADMKQVVQALTMQGYGIQTVSTELGIISTTQKGFKNGATALNIQVSGNTITLRGNLFLPAMHVGNASYTAPTPLEYRGAASSPLMRAWLEMEAVAKALNGVLSYL